MKINLDSKIETSDKEITTITITFNPQDQAEDGMASMIMAVCDTVRQLNILMEALKKEE